MKHPLQKPLLYLITSSCKKTPSFSDARESDFFRERSRLFELEFWNKKNSLTRADGGRWSSLYDDRYHSVVLEHSAAAWCVTPLENAFRLVFEAFFLARRFAKIDYSWCVFFSFLSRFSPISQNDTRHTLRAQKQKTDEEKDQQQKSPTLTL
jgi:hypothetical protein